MFDSPHPQASISLCKYAHKHIHVMGNKSVSQDKIYDLPLSQQLVYVCVLRKSTLEV